MTPCQEGSGIIIDWGSLNKIYEIEMYGTLFHWPDDWAIDKSIGLFDCTFTRINQDKNVLVRTELEAENEPEAKEMGSHVCRIESQIFAFSSDTLLILDPTYVRVKEKVSDTTTGFKMCSLDAIIAPPNTLTTIQLESALSRAHGTLRKENSDNMDLLKRAMDWYTLGKMEKESNIDRFIKFWIALEVLVDDEEGNIVERVKNALIKVYPEIEIKIKQDGVIGAKMFNLRSKIFHEGKLSSGELKDLKLDIGTQLKQTEDILTDLLRFKLGLPAKTLSRKYFA